MFDPDHSVEMFLLGEPIESQETDMVCRLRWPVGKAGCCGQQHSGTVRRARKASSETDLDVIGSRMLQAHTRAGPASGQRAVRGARASASRRTHA